MVVKMTIITNALAFFGERLGNESYLPDKAEVSI